MSRSYWLPAIALGLSVSSWAVYAQPMGDDTRGSTRTDNSQTKPQNDQEPLQFEAIQRAIERLISAVEAQKNDTDAKRKDQREESDLNAQWQMARWTENAVYVAVASCILSFIGILLIWSTLIHTRRAAEAARDANDIMRSEQRPWIKIKIKGAALTVKDGLLIAEIAVECRNIGRAPAFDVHVGVRVFDIMRGEGNIALYELFFEDQRRKSGSVIHTNMLPEDRQTVRYTWHNDPADRSYELNDLFRNRFVFCVCAAYRPAGGASAVVIGEAVSLRPAEQSEVGFSDRIQWVQFLGGSDNGFISHSKIE